MTLITTAIDVDSKNMEGEERLSDPICDISDKDEQGTDNLLAPKSFSFKSCIQNICRKSCKSNCSDFGALCRRHPFATVFAVIIVLAATTICTMGFGNTCLLDASYYVPVSKQNIQEPYNVILYGDSLITGNHFQNFGLFPLLTARIQSLMPNYNLNFNNLAHAGDGIIAMRDRLPSVLQSPGDAVIMFWDSDVSANLETPENIDELRRIYISNVSFVINAIQQNRTGIKIALAGPGILGEGPLIKKVPFTVYHQKKIMLNAYSAINQDIANSFNITYIDVRSAYLSQLPFYRLTYGGCLTVDGEHENTNGMQIISKLFARAIFEWM